MFDNSSSAKLSRRLANKNSGSVSKPQNQGSSSVYTELKLSEQLNDTLALVRNQVAQLTDALEHEQEKSQNLQIQISKLRLKLKQKDQELSMMN